MARTLESGSGDQHEITPDDNNNLLETNGVPQVTKCIYLGTGGDVRVVTEKGQIVTHKNKVGGVWHPDRVIKIQSTGTTASDIIVGF